MDKHICKQCGKTFNYCRACVFKKIPYKEAGFCSTECSAEFKKPKPVIEEIVPVVKEFIPVTEDVGVVVMIDEDMTISENE
jgi:hypothetical protein